MPADDLRSDEIVELLNEVKQRVRLQHPSSAPAEGGGRTVPRIPIADLMPLVHARDAAQAKMAAIGSVNPRSGGPVNAAIQFVKRLVARSLGWFVRDQVTFNRQTVACVESVLEALNEMNRSISMLAGSFADMEKRAAVLLEDDTGLKDLAAHWREWRVQWEKALAANEMQFLRSVADLQIGFSHRATQMESNFRDVVKTQHTDFLAALDRNDLAIQKKLWADLENIRLEYERLIYSELRVIRQRARSVAPAISPLVIPALAAPAPDFDYGRFAERFRGSEEHVRATQEFYVPYFQKAGGVLDLGCGRGEFLDLMRERGVRAEGVDSGAESVRYCLSRGLEVTEGDIFEYLAGLPENSEDGIFASQLVEHLEPARLPSLVRLCASRLRKGGVLAFETPNPECLAILATHFFLDPTHTRPVPIPLLSFYMEEVGIGKIEVHRFSPAGESFPEIKLLPAAFADRFFGGMDYAILGIKL